ncbi:hypothetical protein ACF0H5_004306 [Mactra antiquata]
MLSFSVLNIGYVQSSDYGIYQGSCDDNSDAAFTYEPAYVYDVFQKETVNFGNKIGRTADYAILSPTIVKVGCIELLNYSSAESDRIKSLNHHARGIDTLFKCSLYCAKITENIQRDITHLLFGYDNMTCYCLVGINKTSMVNDECVNEFNDTNRDYIFVYEVYDINKYNITEIVPYEHYFKLCQYVSVTSTNNISLAFGECNLQVDGIICTMNLSIPLQMCTDNFDISLRNQCILHKNPETLEDAQSLCEDGFGFLTYKPDLTNLRSLLSGYRNDKLYALNGYREIFTYKRKLNGTECVNVFNNRQNNNAHYCRSIKLCFCCKKLNTNVNSNINEIELNESHRQTETDIHVDTQHSDDDHVHTSSALLPNIDVDSDAVSGRMLMDDDTTHVHDSNDINSDLDVDGGAVPGRMLDGSDSGCI